MARMTTWAIIAMIVAAVSLWTGSELLSLWLSALRLPGWLATFGLFAMLALFTAVLMKLRCAPLAKGDLINFLHSVANYFRALAGTFIGVSLFAGGHWLLVRTGYGLHVAMLSVMLAGSFAWISYELVALYKQFVEPQ